MIRRLWQRHDPAPVGNLVAYAADPVGFAKDILGIELHSGQAEVLQSLVHQSKVAAPCGYGCGSTTIAAVAVLWWLSTRRPAAAITVAPTIRQAEEILWRCVRKLHRQSGALPGLPGRNHWSPEPRKLAMGVTDARRVPDGTYEAENILWIEDGTGGHPSELPFDMPLGPGCRHLKLGRVSSWHTVPIKTTEVASLGVPGLVDQDWLNRLRLTYLEHTDVYRSRVLGLLPVKQAEQ